jgi:hypothetical protein
MDRIYVAGPYSAGNIIDVLNNIQRGIKQCAMILKKGRYAVYCPWLDYQYHFFEPGITVEQYQNNSMAWLEVSDLMVVLPGWEKSKGTKKEIARAKERGIEIIYVVEGNFR